MRYPFPYRVELPADCATTFTVAIRDQFEADLTDVIAEAPEYSVDALECGFRALATQRGVLMEGDLNGTTGRKVPGGIDASLLNQTMARTVAALDAVYNEGDQRIVVDAIRNRTTKEVLQRKPRSFRLAEILPDEH